MNVPSTLINVAPACRYLLVLGGENSNSDIVAIALKVTGIPRSVCVVASMRAIRKRSRVQVIVTPQSAVLKSASLRSFIERKLQIVRPRVPAE
jgi:hypothetical protein